MMKYIIKVIVTIVLVACLFTGCCKQNEIDMKNLYSDKVNFNNYSNNNSVDFKQDKGVILKCSSLNDKLIIFDEGKTIDTIDSASISQCQIHDSGVYYVSAGKLLFWNFKTKTNITIIEKVNSFVLHNDMIVCSMHDNKLVLLDYDYNEVFIVEDALNYAVTNEFIYYTSLDDVLFRLTLSDFTKSEELVKFDIARYPYSINVSDSKVIIDQGIKFLIYDHENARSEIKQCLTPSVTEQNYKYEVQSFICSESKIYYCGYMSKYSGSFSSKAKSEYNGVYVIDLFSSEIEKISSNTYSELYNFGENLFGIRDDTLYIIDINDGSEKQVYK